MKKMNASFRLWAFAASALTAASFPVSAFAGPGYGAATGGGGSAPTGAFSGGIAPSMIGSAPSGPISSSFAPAPAGSTGAFSAGMVPSLIGSAPAINQAPLRSAPSVSREGVVNGGVRSVSPSRIVSGQLPQGWVNRGGQQPGGWRYAANGNTAGMSARDQILRNGYVRSPAPQRTPDPSGGAMSRYGSHRHDDGDHDNGASWRRRHGFVHSPFVYYNNLYTNPGFYSPITTDYNYPYLYVQTFGYPFSALPLGPAETNPYVYPQTSSEPPPPAAATDTPADAQQDDLVHDVQAELQSRGYFTGKVNGIVSKDFQGALRRFQADQQLVASGLINQATLYALGLN